MKTASDATKQFPMTTLDASNTERRKVAAMSGKRLIIQLDANPSGVYYTGQVVSGSVVLLADSNRQSVVNSKGFYLHVKGRAKVDVGTGYGYSDRTRDDYMKQTIYLVPPDRADDRSMQVQRGRRYPFSFILPQEIPSSFQGKYGDVRYSMQAVVKVSSFFKSHYVSKVHVIDVNTVVDLNSNETALLRQSARTPNSDINAEAWLDRTGYVPGQAILLNGKIENRSGKSIRKTTIQLVQAVTYTDKIYIRKEKKVLFQRKEEKIRDRYTRIWDRFPIKVPAVAPSGLPYCNLINVSYMVKVIIDPGLFKPNLVIRLNIVMGSVALRNSDDVIDGPTTSRPDSPISADRSSNILYAWNVDSPPPSYEECERNGFPNEMKLG